MTKLNSPRIIYVSAPPGVGKTRAAINYMAKHVKRGLNNKHPGYIFYVFPTIELGTQTYEGLKSKIPKRLHDNFLFFVEAGKDGEYSDKRQTDIRVYDILDGRAHKNRAGGFLAQPFLEGSILFMTHATFLKLRKHEKFAKTKIIFDEARSWVINEGRDKKLNKFTDKVHQRYMQALFTEEPLLIRSDEGLVPHKYITRIVPRAIAANKKARLWSKCNKSDVPIQATSTSLSLDALHNQLQSRGNDTVRMQAFCFRQGKNFVQLAMPYYPFIGFQEVLVLAADFEQSQMYHLLNKEHATIEDWTEAFIDRYGEKDYASSLASIRARYKQLRIVPLLKEAGVGSKHQLSSGVVLPESKMLELRDMLTHYEMNTSDLREIIKLVRNGGRHDGVALRSKHHSLIKELEEMGAEYDVLGWQLKQAEKLVRDFRKEKGNACAERAVLVVNDAYKERKIKKHTYVSLGKVEGNNKYQHTNAVTFLAACNPDPAVAQLLRAYLDGTDYDPDEDYVISKTIQSLGRGNIRDHNSKEKMLAVVSTQGIADRVKARMGGYPVVTNHARELEHCFWSSNNASRQTVAARTEAESERLKKERLNKYKANPINKKLISLRASRSRLKRLLAEATDKDRRKELKAKFLAKDAEIKELEGQRVRR